MTGISFASASPETPATSCKEGLLERRAGALWTILNHLMELHTCGGSSSVSHTEAYDLMQSACFVLGIEDLQDPAAAVLDCDDPMHAFRQKLEELHGRYDEVEGLWRGICIAMPSINNIALRDTLASIGGFRARYDTLFAADQVPCDIDYPLHRPIPESLKGLDYLQAWLETLWEETRFIARFDAQDCIDVLESWCPDYKGLLINLYEPIHDAYRNGKITPQRGYPPHPTREQV
ncbi:MAG: DUF6179 domain-containing protein [Eggerthellaceae bacterium]